MENSQRIQRVSLVMQWLCYLTLLLLPLSLVWAWSNFGQYAPTISAQRGFLLDMAYISQPQLLFAFVISFAPALLLMYGIWKLAELFALYQKGVFFTQDNSRNLYVFSMALLFTGVAKIIVEALLSVILTWGNPPGMKALSIKFGSGDFSILFIAGVLMSVAWIMREAHKLAEENAEFV